MLLSEPELDGDYSRGKVGNRSQTEKSWLLFEGIDTFLYDLSRTQRANSPPRAAAPPRTRPRSPPLGILANSLR